MIAPEFIHLRVHSAYSLLEGAIHVARLPELAAEMGMPAIAICDTNNLFGALEFSETAARAGIQPIMGLQLSVGFNENKSGGTLGEKPTPPAPVALYAQTETGWHNLMTLASSAYLDTEAGAEPHVPLAALERYSEGLICLTGGAMGPPGRLLATGKQDGAEALVRRFATAFPDRLYIELHRHGRDAPRTPEEETTEAGLIDLAYGLDLPLVAANEVYFETPEMFQAHDALICIGEGTYVNESDRRMLTPEHYFKSPAEMIERFQDLPEAIENTVEIARRCSARPKGRAPILPKFADDEAEELRRQAREGLKVRLDTIPLAVSEEEYKARLESEFEIIEKTGFPGYFLIVADFIKWAKDHDIPVGPGRGSGAGSLVAYALTITDLDPLRYNLLFERFLNTERTSVPDFDIDFCQDRREEVIRYVQEKYGRDRVAQIITFGGLLSKVAVRDVGRVLQMSYHATDKIAKLIPVEGVKPVSIERARKEEPQIEEAAQSEETVAVMLDIAGKLEGLLRNASTHAAGIVIGDRPLTELAPLYRDPRSDMPATQFNMKWVEAAGLVKFDFLGLKTLTAIQNAVDLLKLRGITLDISTIDLEDQKTFELYGKADTVGVFQVESAGMRSALVQMQPNCLEDIVALVALYRPGPMENIPKFCNVKNEREARENIDPMIDSLLDETQGIIVYQEQVMQIAQKMANYSLGEADKLRHAMGKKIRKAMDAEKPKFLKGAQENGINGRKAEKVWNLLEKFADYGFNKSHAAAYALVSYQTAWLKANHPVEFMAAVMNLDLHLTDKLNIFVQEARRMDIPVAPPCVNRSETRFTVRDGQILYALGALKNTGVDAMQLIVDAREAAEKTSESGGAFSDLYDFARRVDLRAVGKRPLEALTRAGGFDALEQNRRKILESIDALIDYSVAFHDEKHSNQVSLFGAQDGGDEGLPPPRLAKTEDWLPAERLREEYTAAGFYLSRHPLEDYAEALERQKILSHKAFIGTSGGGRIAGTLTTIRKRKSARGAWFAFIGFSDTFGAYEVMAFSDVLNAEEDKLKPGANLVLWVDTEDEGGRLMLRSVQRIEEVVADKGVSGLRVYIEDLDAMQSIKARLESQKGQASGQGEVRLVFDMDLDSGSPDKEVELLLPGAWMVGVEMKGALKAAPGVSRVEEF